MIGAKTLVGAVVLAVLSGGALGQDAPLKGPPVKQDRPAGLEGQFADGKGDRKGPLADRVPMRAYAQAVEKLRGDDAPENLRLSAAQDNQIRKIESEFRSAMQEYTRRSRAEGGGKPGKANEEEPMTDESRRARMQELMRNAPNPTDAQVKVYALLSAPQRAFVEAEVAKVQAEVGKRRSEEYAQRLIRKKQGDGQAQRPAKPDQPLPAAPDGRERARRVMEKLQRLSPQERDQLLDRLEAELDRRAAGDGNRARPRSDRKPAPSMDEIDVPKPDHR